MSRSTLVGLDVDSYGDIRALIDNVCKAHKVNFLCVDLFPRRDMALVNEQNLGSIPPITLSDLPLASDEWTTYVVGKMSRNMQLDSPDPAMRHGSELVFVQEMMWAAHLAVTAVLLPAPDRQLGIANYARWANHLLQTCSYVKPWVPLPLCYSDDGAGAASAAAEGPDSAEDSGTASRLPSAWSVWNTIRTMCDHHTNLGLLLELTTDLPSDRDLERWIAEPVKALLLPASVFLTNRMGYPVLSKRHQAVVQRFFEFRVEFILSGVNETDLPKYRAYLAHLISTVPPLSAQEQFEAPYFDFLQVPLQPLQDNLESRTYEVFEKDPVKYVQYEKAVEKALIARGQPSAVIMVVGAGRGPLVRASLRAAQTAGVRVVVYAVEKNPNAVFTLQHLHGSLQWGDTVRIVWQDMRVWEAPEPADILVSELLGSFSDNELSPECLDGAQRFLKPDGISIPCRYVSYLAPVSTSKVHADIRATSPEVKSFETLYVVRLRAVKQLARAQACFTFTHPNHTSPIDNTRFTTLTFPVADDAILHGFAGYFEAQLYDDVYISTNPETYSTGMFSWFPAFFPLATPLLVQGGQRVVLSMWRQCGKGRVWYEWAVSEPVPTAIHNPKGRSYWIGL